MNLSEMINLIYKNKSGGGLIKIVGATALDYRAQYLDDDSVEFSITKEDLVRYFLVQPETLTEFCRLPDDSFEFSCLLLKNSG